MKLMDLVVCVKSCQVKFFLTPQTTNESVIYMPITIKATFSIILKLCLPYEFGYSTSNSKTLGMTIASKAVQGPTNAALNLKVFSSEAINTNITVKERGGYLTYSSMRTLTY